ncbi:leucine-rich repeat-containing protein 37A-like [Nannospalax galili]|uniref:leucine-rich repeat-containing protein 37A-like n=1 Tax=Nannospalax galili TaxID=1026970 RepID=UPI00111C3AC9|nr:leucine-rich repeat-containing protein 37A-like [Nannospalax galili]
MNEAYSESVPLQSQADIGEPPERPEQFEPSRFQVKTQTHHPDHSQAETLDYLPQPPDQHQLDSEASMHPENNDPFPNRNEAEHSNWPNVTAKPTDLEITVTSEAEKEAEAILSQQQRAPVQLPESPEEVGPSSVPQEAPGQTSDFPEDLETSGSQLEVPALPTKLPEEVSAPVEQEASVSGPDSSIQNTVETPTAVQTPSQEQVHHYSFPTITVNPADVERTVTSEPSPSQQQPPVKPSVS